MLQEVVDERPPDIIPPGWKVFRYNNQDAGITHMTIGGLAIIFSISKMDDGSTLSHISFSRRDRYPSWDEMRDFLYEFPLINPTKQVMMILPPKSEYVNIHSNCFHWWQKRAQCSPNI